MGDGAGNHTGSVGFLNKGLSFSLPNKCEVKLIIPGDGVNYAEFSRFANYGSTVSNGMDAEARDSLPRISRIFANGKEKFVRIREIRGLGFGFPVKNGRALIIT